MVETTGGFSTPSGSVLVTPSGQIVGSADPTIRGGGGDEGLSQKQIQEIQRRNEERKRKAREAKERERQAEEKRQLFILERRRERLANIKSGTTAGQLQSTQPDNRILNDNARSIGGFIKGFSRERTGSVLPLTLKDTFNQEEINLREQFFTREPTIKEERRRVEEEFLQSRFDQGRQGFISVGGISTPEGEQEFFQPSESLIEEAKAKGRKEITIFGNASRLGSSSRQFTEGVVTNLAPQSKKEFATDVALYGSSAGLAFGGKIAGSILKQSGKARTFSLLSGASTGALAGATGYGIYSTGKGIYQAPTEFEAGAIAGKSTREGLVIGAGLKSGFAEAGRTTRVDILFPERTRFKGEITGREGNKILGEISGFTESPRQTLIFEKADIIASKFTKKDPTPKVDVFNRNRFDFNQKFNVDAVTGDISQGKSVSAIRRKGAKSLTKFEDVFDISKRKPIREDLDLVTSFGANVRGTGARVKPNILGIEKEFVGEFPVRLNRVSKGQKQFDILFGRAESRPFISKSLVQDIGEVGGFKTSLVRSNIITKKSISPRGRRTFQRDIFGLIRERSSIDGGEGSAGQFIFGQGLKQRKINALEVSRISNIIPKPKPAKSVPTKNLVQLQTTTTPPITLTSQRTESIYAGTGLYERTNEVSVLAPPSQSQSLIQTNIKFQDLSQGKTNIAIPSFTGVRTRTKTFTQPKIKDPILDSPINIQEQGLLLESQQIPKQQRSLITGSPFIFRRPRITRRPILPRRRSTLFGGRSFGLGQRGRQRLLYTPSLVGSSRFNILGRSAGITRREALARRGSPLVREVIIDSNILRRRKTVKKKTKNKNKKKK